MTTLGYLLFNLTYVTSSYPAGLLSDRIGRWPIMAAGIFLYSALYLGFAYASAAAIWPLLALYGVYNGATQGVSKALVADHAPADRRGTAIGFYFMAAGLATLIGNLLAGRLWDVFGPRATFLLGAGMAAVALLLIPATRSWGASASRGRPA